MRKILLVLAILSTFYVNGQNVILGTKIEKVFNPSELPDSMDGEPVSIYKQYPEWNIFVARKGDFTNLRCVIVEYPTNKKLTPFIYGDIEDFDQRTKLAKVSLNSKYGIINASGKIIIPCVYDWIDLIYTPDPVKYYLVSKDDRYGIINEKNETVVPFEYDRISDWEVEGLLGLTRYGKRGVMQFPSRKTIIPIIYDSFDLLQAGGLRVKKGPLYTILDYKGNQTWKNWYSFLEIKGYEKFALVEQNGRMGTIDYTEKQIIPIKYEVLKRINRYSGVLFIAARDGKYGILERDGKIVAPLQYEMIKTTGVNFLIASKNNKYGLLNLDGTPFLPFEYDEIVEHNGFFKVKKENKYGVVSQNGTLVLPVEYDLLGVGLFVNKYKTTDPYLLAAKNGKKGIIDINKWNFPVECIYDDLIGIGKRNYPKETGQFFDNSVIAVKKGNYGVIDMNGKEVLPFVYEDMQYVSEYLVIARKNNKYGVVDIHDHIVLPFEYQFINCKDYKLVAFKKEYEIYLAIGDTVSKTDK